MKKLIGGVCIAVAVVVVGAPATDKGPGTYFNPTDGNVVAAVADASRVGVAKRTVAFLGGSITEMNGFRPRLMDLLRARHPDIAFTEIAAGLSSTCSDTGAFRLDRDVLAKGMPDLLIVDAAVNDDQDGHFDLRHCIRGYEGIVRRMLLANPRCRIVLAQMVNAHQYNQISKGEEPIPYQAGRRVAEHYGLAVADVGTALVASAKAGGLSWKEYRDCHPSPEGCVFGADVVLKAVASAIDFRHESAARTLPVPLDPHSYFRGRELDLRSVQGAPAWSVVRPDWNAVPGSKRGYFTQGEVLCCSQANVPATFSFSGATLGALLTAGPDAGDLEVSIDGGAFRRLRLRADYGSLHYPYLQMFADDLSDGSHTVQLRIVPAKRGNATGTTVRINRLYAN